MDPVSHVLLGASLAYGVAHRSLGRTAAAVGGLAAFVPDADVFIRSAADPLLATEYHRHFTHSLLFAPFGAAVVGACWFWRSRHRTQRGLIYGCALLAYVSHCLLDAATSYGTQLLWPLTNRRLGWDAISVIDPAFTLPLLVALLWALVRRRPAVAHAGLAVAALYLVFGFVQHRRAVSAQAELAAKRGHNPARVEVMPTMANNLVWRALYEHDGRIYSDRIRVGWFSPATVRAGWSLPLIALEDLTPAERSRNQRRSFERFAWFSEGWVARSPAAAGVLGDMRYSLSAAAFDPIWGIRFTPPNAPTEIEWINRSRDRQINGGELWAEISGRDPRFEPVATFSLASDRNRLPGD